jgi:hypothetical protein
MQRIVLNIGITELTHRLDLHGVLDLHSTLEG